MPLGKVQSDQIVNDAILPVLRTAARAPLKDILPAIDKNFNSPLRLFASNPSDALLNIAAQEVQQADGTGKSAPPTSSTIPTVPASTINFQSGATTGATFSGLTFPSTTVGQFRRLGLTLLASGQINAIWSPAAASVGALANPGTLFVPTGIPLGWIDLEATASTAYKTAGSATSIVENAVGGVSRIHVFGSGGGGAGTGNANSFQIELEDRLGSSYFNCMTPNIFEVDGSNKVDNSSTGTYDIANRVFSLPSIGNNLLSTQSYDPTFLASFADSIQVELNLLWGTKDPSAIYEASRDGGQNWSTFSMAEVGVSNKYRGILMFPDPTTVLSLVTNDVSNADSQRALNASTLSSLATSFVVGSGVKWRTKNIRAFMNKLGSPTGTLIMQIVKDSSGSPSLLNTDIVCESVPLSIAGLASGNISVDFALTQPLPAGTYWMVLRTDAAYKASYSAGVAELRWRSDNSSPSYAGVFKSFDGSSWSAALSDDACFLIQGITYDLRVRVTSATASVAIYGYGIFYEEDSLGMPADNEEYQTFDVDGSADVTSFVVTNFNVNPKCLKIYDTDSNKVYRFPNFACSGNTIAFPAGTFIQPGKHFRLIFEQSPTRQGYSTDKLSNVFAANGLGSTDGAFDFSSPGIGPIVRRPDGAKRMISLDDSDNIVISSVP